MREGWIECPIHELGNSQRPVLKAGPFGSSVTKATYQISGYKVYGQQEVVAKDVNAGSYFVSETTFKTHRGCAVEPGDILMTMMGTVGRVFRLPENTPEGIINPRLVRISVDHDRICSKFVEISLEQQWIQRLLERRSQGGTMPGLNLEAIASIKLNIPPIDEQYQIAKILRTWDEAIEKLNGLRTAYESRLLGLRDALMARASRQGRPACFGDFLTESRIPGSNGATARKISVRLYGKGTLEKNSSRSGSANTRYYRRKTGQIIWSKLDFLNGAFALIGPELDGCESTLDLPAFDCDPSVNPAWLIEYLTRPAYYTRQIHLARGQRKARRVAPDDWLASPLRLPDRATQDHIADILSCAREELALLDAEINAVTRQKRGLMQKLLTGVWRVSC